MKPARLPKFSPRSHSPEGIRTLTQLEMLLKHPRLPISPRGRIIVSREGFEPSHPKAPEPDPCVSTKVPPSRHCGRPRELNRSSGQSVAISFFPKLAVHISQFPRCPRRCSKRDSNPHTRRHRILSPACLPKFHHSSIARGGRIELPCAKRRGFTVRCHHQMAPHGHFIDRGIIIFLHCSFPFGFQSGKSD